MASPINVPRWTPSPSPTRPLVKESTTTRKKRSDDDAEMQSMASEEDGMYSSSMERVFPFSIAPNTTIATHSSHSDIYETPSSRRMIDSKVQEYSLEMEEVEPSIDGEGKGNFVTSAAKGVCLTWKELRVTVGDRKSGRRRPILEGLTGYAGPGEVLAIMGPSGCGKSTLLDALAGE
ncbi:hypothetical protein L1049_024205 [Liquidambar formosana]|uniref:ABC transporter domain-containing protein n=1 Tax=Liquidambar formosana TaxID=63359 RepID=A0AAP0X4D9_LIQFO